MAGLQYGRNPGDNLTFNNRFSRMLMRDDANAGPIRSHPQGWAKLARNLLAGFAMGQDRRESEAATEATNRGMSAQPWINPDTGTAMAPQRMPEGESGPPQMVPTGPAGGLEGAISALQKLPGNEYAQRSLQGLLMQRMETQAATALRQQDRDWVVGDRDLARSLVLDDRAEGREHDARMRDEGWAYAESQRPTYEIVQSPYGKGGSGMRNSLTGEITGYQAPASNPPLTREAKAQADFLAGRIDRPTLDAILASTGRPGVEVSIDQKGRGAEMEALGKAYAARYGQWAEQADAAQATLDSLAQFEAGTGGFETGPLGDTRATLSAFAQFVGIDPETLNLGNAGDAQSMQAAANQLALRARSAGGGMPGQMSDKDLKFLVDSVVGLGRTPEGNQLIAAFMGRAATRAIERVQAAEAWLEEKRTLRGFESKWRQHVNANPLFTDQDRSQLRQAGSSELPAPRADAPTMNPLPGSTPEAVERELRRRGINQF